MAETYLFIGMAFMVGIVLGGVFAVWIERYRVRMSTRVYHFPDRPIAEDCER